MSPRNTNAAAPLKAAVFHILLALSDGDHHGLGIAAVVEENTDGAISLGPGTLYRSLKEMTQDGLVREVAPPPGDEDPRRKFYRLTRAGREALRTEASRYERIVNVARKRAVLRGAR